ncbi:MAG: hypothetical protein JRF63_09510 [Deltaproteobacteria bacterium]|nr:hypothetical protein [Deltaproteobacteria bacterium]
MRAVRELERATALVELKHAEVAREEIAAELERVERRLIEIAEGAGPPPPGTVTSAGALAAGSRRHALDRDQIDRLEADRSEIITRLGEAGVAVDRSREGVVVATRALRALGL